MIFTFNFMIINLESLTMCAYLLRQGSNFTFPPDGYPFFSKINLFSNELISHLDTVDVQKFAELLDILSISVSFWLKRILVKILGRVTNQKYYSASQIILSSQYIAEINVAKNSNFGSGGHIFMKKKDDERKNFNFNLGYGERNYCLHTFAFYRQNSHIF